MLVNLKNRWLPSSDSPSYTAISPLSSEKHYDADVEAAATPEHFSVTHQFYDRPQSLASPDASLVRDERDTKEHYGRVTSQNRDTRIDPRIVSDAIIGLSDGLTVPFALTAGLSALGDIDIVVYGGLAELIAGAISMGLGGYLGAKSEKESYDCLYRKTRDQVATHKEAAAPSTISGSSTAVTWSPRSSESNPDATQLKSELSSIFTPYASHISASTLSDLQNALLSLPPHLLTDFVMHHAHHTIAPAASRPLTCALTIASGYFFGGLVPLLPYLVLCFLPAPFQEGEQTTSRQLHALVASIILTAIILFTFGYVKTIINTSDDCLGPTDDSISATRTSKRRRSREKWRRRYHATLGGVQMLVVGGTAAGAAMAFVNLGRMAAAGPTGPT